MLAQWTRSSALVNTDTQQEGLNTEKKFQQIYLNFNYKTGDHLHLLGSIPN